MEEKNQAPYKEDGAGQAKGGRPEPLQPVAGELGKGLPEGAGEQGDPPGLPEGDSKQENSGKAESEAPDQHQAGISICCGLRHWETLQAVVNCLTGFILRHTMWAALHLTLRRFIDGPIHPEDFN